MRLNMKFAGVAVCALLLSACAQQPKEDLNTQVSSAPAPAGPVAGSQEDLDVTAGARVFFAFDSFQLSQEAQGTLRRQAAWLAANPTVRVVVEGHADERGTREYNLALGQRRANSAEDFLVSLGVDPSRISIISYGEERPVQLGSNEQSWSLNRNATTKVQGGPTS